MNLDSSDLGDVDRRILSLILELGEVNSKQIEESLGISRSSAIKHAKDLEQQSFLRRKEIPHQNSGMPPAFVYHLTDKAPLEEIKRLEETQKETNLDEASEERGDLTQIIQSISKPSTEHYFWAALKRIADFPEITANEIANHFGWSRQSTHSRLKSLLDKQVIQRKEITKNGTRQFSHSLAPGFSEEGIKSVKVPKNQAPKNISKPMEEQTSASNSSNQRSGNSLKLPEKLPMLPEFDPEWSEEVKAQWLQAYNNLMLQSRENKT